MEEREVIERCKSGDEFAWSELVKKYWKDVYRIVFSMVFDREVTKDITQEIFVKLFTTIKKFDEKRGSFENWIKIISRNYTIDYLRKKGDKNSSGEVGEFLKYGAGKERIDTPYKILRREEKKAFLKECMSCLKEDYKILIVMRDIENLSYLEIAEKLNMPLGTVKSKINRARVELARIVIERKKYIGE